MNKTNFKANIIFSFISRLVIYLTPLFVAPYLSRVLGAEGIGIYSHAYSFVYYFFSAIGFGFSSCGINKIAEYRNDKEKYSAYFWTTFFLRSIFFVIATAVYILILVVNGFGHKVDLNIGLALLLVLISSLLENLFLFQGLEIFLIPSIGDCLVNIGYAVCIFCFVKNSSDVLLYTILKSAMNVVLYLGTSIISFHYLNKPKILWHSIGALLKESSLFFLPTILMSLGSQLDQSFIGSFCTEAEVGYYQQASKLPNIVSSLTYAISPVMLSRISYLYHEKKYDEIKEKITKGLTLALFISVPACVGLYSTGQLLLPLYFGEEFSASVVIMYILLPVCILSPIDSILINAYYYASKRNKYLTLSLAFAITSNIAATIINILVFNMGGKGAALGTLIAEIVLFTFLIIGAIKAVNFSKIGSDVWKILLGSGFVAFASTPCCYFLPVLPVYRVIISVLIGVLIYAITMLVTKEKIFCFILEGIKAKLKKQKH